MAKEADFYSPGEAAKVLGFPERQVLGMVVSGELEGQQDQWARWRIPVSAIRRARRFPEPPEDHAGPPAASDDDATTVGIDHPPPWKSSDEPDDEKPVGEPVGGDELYPRRESGEEATQRLPRGDQIPAPDAAVVEDLRPRLKLAEQARSRLEEEVRRLGEENKRLREELEAERGKGIFDRMFGE